MKKKKSLPEVLPDSTPNELLESLMSQAVAPPLPHLVPNEGQMADPPPPYPLAVLGEEEDASFEAAVSPGPAVRKHQRTLSAPLLTPLRAIGPVGENGVQAYQYWLFPQD